MEPSQNSVKTGPQTRCCVGMGPAPNSYQEREEMAECDKHWLTSDELKAIDELASRPSRFVDGKEITPVMKLRMYIDNMDKRFWGKINKPACLARAIFRLQELTNSGGPAK